MNNRFEIVAEKINNDVKNILRRVYDEGYSAGLNKGKEKYGQNIGFASCTRASNEDIKKYGTELFGWCSCGKSIEGRWVEAINFCPWCGKIINWKNVEKEANNA